MQIREAIRYTLLICLFLIYSGTGAQSTQRSLLLVCRDNTTLESLTHAEVRKLFLGVPVTKTQMRLKPLVNASDQLVTEVFLQQVIFMSKREYERQLLSRVFRLGDQRPPVYEDTDLLVEALLDTPGSVSFMWSEQVERQKGLKTLSVLWTDSTD